MTDGQALRICLLNDAFRPTLSGGKVYFAVGVSEKGVAFNTAALAAVRAFSDFTADNNPYGEHDFGSLVIAGEKLFWKIDYYDQSLRFGSEYPAAPAQTTRVLTIMLAEECPQRHSSSLLNSRRGR